MRRLWATRLRCVAVWRPGDEVVLIGRQGDQQVTADEFAEILGTIHHEIVTALSSRVPRLAEEGAAP